MLSIELSIFPYACGSCPRQNKFLIAQVISPPQTATVIPAAEYFKKFRLFIVLTSTQTKPATDGQHMTL